MLRNQTFTKDLRPVLVADLSFFRGPRGNFDSRIVASFRERIKMQANQLFVLFVILDRPVSLRHWGMDDFSRKQIEAIAELTIHYAPEWIRQASACYLDDYPREGVLVDIFNFFNVLSPMDLVNSLANIAHNPPMDFDDFHFSKTILEYAL